MNPEELAVKIKEMAPWLHNLDFGNGVTTNGLWDPVVQFNFLEQELPQSLDGKTVIDAGCNAGGLSVEFAKRGAKVTGIEYSRKYFGQAQFYKEQCHIDNVEYINDTLFNLHTYPQCDILLVLGIVYHCRHFQFLLDYISHIKADKIFISTQTSPGNELSMTSRLRLAKENQTPQGWEPTVPMFLELLALSGFTEIKHLAMPKDTKGFTNRCYVVCKPGKPVNVDINLLSSLGKYQSYIWS